VVDSSTASSTTGVVVKSAVSGTGASITALSTSGSDSLNLSSKGSGNITLQTGGVSHFTVGPTNFSFTRALRSGGGALIKFSYVNAADTTVIASTEVNEVYFNNGSAIPSHNTGNITTQRDFRVTGTVHAFLGASTITTQAAFSVDGPASAGTNSTVTNAIGFYIPTTTLTGTVTNAYGISITAPSGATNNYAALFSGQIVYGGTTPSIAGGTGAGTSPTVGIAGANSGGVITITTGTTPGSSSVVATVTFLSPFPNGSSVVLYPGNAATALLSGTSMVYTTGGTTTFTLTSGTVALVAATQYIWNYHVIGY
jgi:hypothetical protein